MPLDFPLLLAPRRAPPWYELGPIAGTTPSLLVRSGVRRGARGFRRPVSVLMVRPEIARNRDATCGRGGFAEAAELFARLEHRAILPVEDIVAMEGGPSLVTAPLAGMTLARVPSLAQGRGRSVSLRVAARLVVELADAVEVLRTAMPVGSALGALSADSAWVTSEGRALLLPSARCASLEGGLAVPGRAMDRYRAPELALGYSDSRADVYALALMLWDLLAPGIAGAPVETAGRTRVMATSVPDAVVELVLRCLSESPGDRLRDAGAFARALSALVAGARDGSSETQREASTLEVEAEELEPTGALQVRILRGAGARREVELTGPVGRWTAGRAPAADLALADPEVSGEHLEIALEPGGRVRIRDLGSKNGVFVNGSRAWDRIVQPEDSVRLGTTVLRLRAGKR